MKNVFVTALALWSLGAVAAPSEESIFEKSTVHMAKFVAEVQKTSQAAAVESVLSILEQDRPAIDNNGVLREGRKLKAEAGEAEKAL